MNVKNKLCRTEMAPPFAGSPRFHALTPTLCSPRRRMQVAMLATNLRSVRASFSAALSFQCRLGVTRRTIALIRCWHVFVTLSEGSALDISQLTNGRGRPCTSSLRRGVKPFRRASDETEPDQINISLPSPVLPFASIRHASRNRSTRLPRFWSSEPEYR